MKTEIKVITDNNPSDALRGEWGLCLVVNYNGEKILVDAGASNLFMKNMEALGESIEDVDFAVLSHAHYDHANGMPAFFEKNTKAKLYVSESTAADCYHKKFIFKKYIGIPKNMLRDYSDRIENVSGVYKIREGVFLVPHSTSNLSSIGKREMMYRKSSDGWKPDDFSHEQSLVIDTDKGLLIINSCSHGGVKNILREVREALPDKKIYGYIGGFHLFNKSKSEVQTVAESLDGDLEYICTGHCTGDRAYDILKQQLGDKLHKLQVGMVIKE
jgi:7,8-dihydropterin-6-yl-methyl-4-(beta-D-ribofuranosyl)aminobenzene 5'-phosphate synthase